MLEDFSEGDIAAPIRLNQPDFPTKFSYMRCGDKILPKRGVYKGIPLKILGKRRHSGQYYVYCKTLTGN